MTVLDKLYTIGKAPAGTRLKVTAAFKPKAGPDVPEGTLIEVRPAFDDSPRYLGGMPVFADIGGKIEGFYLYPEFFHCVELVSEWRA